jgi:uncharacterized RDD family membrane protein YckC
MEKIELSYKKEYRGLWLADPSTRIIASIIDIFFVTNTWLIILFPLAWVGGLVSPYLPPIPEVVVSIILVVLFISAPVFQLYLIEKRGQSIGKKIMKIRIMHQSGAKPSSDRLFFMRYFVPAAIMAIPLVGWGFLLFDLIYLFNEDRRTLRDLMAQTIVVKWPSPS